MKLDPEYLRQHYASLSDEALMALDRADLVETAKAVFDQEVANRKLVLRPPPVEEDDDEAESEVDRVSYDAGDANEWLEDAAEVSSWYVGNENAPAPDSAVDAQHALAEAGIPTSLDLGEIPPEKSLYPYGTHRWRLTVPVKFSLHAASVLERDITNPEFEAQWKEQLEGLSDEELREMTPGVVFCGLFDRIERVNRVYEKEIARRGLK